MERGGDVSLYRGNSSRSDASATLRGPGTLSEVARVSGSVRRLAVAVVLSAVLLVPAAGASVASRAQAPYAGLGTWIDLYATKAWDAPEDQVTAMAGDGVRTLYLETSNYRHAADIVRPDIVGRFVDAAHAAGMRVVAWYLPSFLNLQRDKRRALAAIDFESATGQRFDGFALDIEATKVRNLPLRNHRLLVLSRVLRRAAGPRYPLGAITPSPVGMSPSYWPNIPYRELARTYSVFLPMAYSTLRRVRGTDATRSYLAATVADIRASAGKPRLPIHLIGGLSRAMGARETAGFVQAVAACHVLGYSLYSFAGTRPAMWTALTAAKQRSSQACSA